MKFATGASSQSISIFQVATNYFHRENRLAGIRWRVSLALIRRNKAWKFLWNATSGKKFIAKNQIEQLNMTTKYTTHSNVGKTEVVLLLSNIKARKLKLLLIWEWTFFKMYPISSDFLARLIGIPVCTLVLIYYYLECWFWIYVRTRAFIQVIAHHKSRNLYHQSYISLMNCAIAIYQTT